VSYKIRFLLTSKCTATCAYCHNEGQGSVGSSLLRVGQIAKILGRLTEAKRLPAEIVLSGGEPTLHKHVGLIAQLCKSSGCHVSMDSHGGHPDLLAPALPHLDELKLHIDAFDAEKQHHSMGIDIHHVKASISKVQTHPHIKLLANHPLVDIHTTIAFITVARKLGIDCKIIDLFRAGLTPCINWTHQGYIRQDNGTWLHTNNNHRLHTKSCETKHNHGLTYFIGADGVRLSLDSPIISSVDDFDPIAHLSYA